MKIYTYDELVTAVAKSKDWSDLCKNLGRTRSTHVIKRIKKFLAKFKINTDHFDSYAKLRAKRINPIQTLTCLVCSITFITDCPGRKYCSTKCCNSLAYLGNRRSQNWKDKISTSLVNYYLNHPNSNKRSSKKQIIGSDAQTGRLKKLTNQFCAFCKKQLTWKQRFNQFCCQSCSTKSNWQNPNYRQRILEKINKHINLGKHKGWQTRNKLSYPEKFFKKVLELNGYKNKFKINFPISKRSLGFDDNSNYFLDFYFPEICFDLEIDGKQHCRPERKLSDKIRDKYLMTNGIQPYRIKWVSINSKAGKDYIRKEIIILLNILKEKYNAPVARID